MEHWSLALPVFVITLREGVEAALVVGIVLAILKQTEREFLRPWVWAGVGVGIFVSALIGIGLRSLLIRIQQSTYPVTTVIEPFLKLGFSLLAIALLSWMLIWMTQQAKSIKSDLEHELQTLFSQSRGADWAVFGLIFVAVVREGFETVVFLMAQLQSGWIGLLGAGLGLIGAVVIGWLLFALGVKLNLKIFFQVMGSFLILIVSGLVLSALKNLDVAAIALSALPSVDTNLCLFAIDSGQACLLGPQIWDGTQILPDGAFPGVLLKALFGYRDRIFLLQGIAYALFLGSLSYLYLRSLSTPGTASIKPGTASIKKETLQN